MIRWISLMLLGSLTACGDKDDYVPDPDPVDADRDGYAVEDDCDDFNAAINPGTVEVCDEIDNNCNGEIDENAGREYFLDEDNDGYGQDDVSFKGCIPPDSYVEFDGDCDDTLANVNPGMLSDDCDQLDNDCDGTVDENVGISEYRDFYRDSDGDGYGDVAETISDCRASEGYSALSTDCDDTDPQTFPGAPERCNSTDNNCNGVFDDNYVEEWYPDEDGDGFGNPEKPTEDCDPDDPYIIDDTDCDDAVATTNPRGVEFCDGVDNNCSGDADEHACYTDWNGSYFYEFGKWTVPKKRDCELFWDTTGERVGFDQGLCPFCEFAFTVDYDYDRGTSYDDNGTCKGYTNYLGAPLMGDFSYDWAFTSTFYGYPDYPVFYLGYQSYWYPWVLADADEATGEYSYKNGYKDYPYAGTYYTDYMLDQAILTTSGR